jgi:hypothetical protein
MTQVVNRHLHRILQEEKLYADAVALNIRIPPGLSLAATPTVFKFMQALLEKLLTARADKLKAS